LPPPPRIVLYFWQNAEKLGRRAPVSAPPAPRNFFLFFSFLRGGASGARSAFGASSAFGARSAFGASRAFGASSAFGARNAFGVRRVFGASRASCARVFMSRRFRRHRRQGFWVSGAWVTLRSVPGAMSCREPGVMSRGASGTSSAHAPARPTRIALAHTRAPHTSLAAKSTGAAPREPGAHSQRPPAAHMPQLEPHA